MPGSSETSTSVAPAVPRLPLASSGAWAAQARLVDAVAATADRIISRDRLIEGEFPTYGARAEGAYVWDVDGNRYLDFLLAYGTVILGHSHPAVTEAVVREIRNGFAVSMQRPTRVELARRLVSVIPNAELALLLKTGSDATGAAVRLARAFTGRDVVLRWGYNGWHDWCAIRPRGIPDQVRSTVDTFGYNDLESLDRAFHRHAGRVAAVVMMPFETELPAPGFLQGVRELADRNGTLLVLDELRSGFRLGLGGAQEHFQVRADLVTLGKAMANGYAISAVTGRRDVLEQLAEVHISSTYFANSLAMAASIATLAELAGTDALARVATLGERLIRGLRAVVADAGLSASVVGAPQMPFLRFDYPDTDRSEQAKRLFFTGTIRRGVFLHPTHHWFLSAAMSESDIDHAIEVCRTAARETAAGLRRTGPG